jgi:hypothetical protein
LKVLLDECVDSRLTASLGNFEVRTVADEVWVGISNGQLLSLAAAKFDVFVTVDRNLPFQQHLPKFDRRNSAAGQDEPNNRPWCTSSGIGFRNTDRKGRRGHSDWRAMNGYKPTDNWGQFREYFLTDSFLSSKTP